jgi:YgiT-type zinc finger domain-containing protein
MKCIICKHDETRPGTTTVTLYQDRSTIVIKDVPGDVCDNYGEYDLIEVISARVLEIAKEAVRHNAEVEGVRFAA